MNIKNVGKYVVATATFLILMIATLSVSINDAESVEKPTKLSEQSIEEVLLPDISSINECSNSLSIGLGFTSAIASDRGEDDGSGSECTAVSCRINAPSCDGIGSCSYRTTCNACTCTLKDICGLGNRGTCGN